MKELLPALVSTLGALIGLSPLITFGLFIHIDTVLATVLSLINFIVVAAVVGVYIYLN